MRKANFCSFFSNPNSLEHYALAEGLMRGRPDHGSWE